MQADFARQLAERNAKANPTRKFRSAAPKGSRLAAGYTDRTKERLDDAADETAQRIKNLEDAMKLGQIDRDMFEKLVQDITGGDLTATHLVKGLDRKLLERVRKGEDVFGQAAEEEEEDLEQADDVEDEFDELAERDIDSIVREKDQKKGEVAPSKPVAGVKRSRADILAELKRQREEAAAEAAAEYEKKYPSLGKGFRKVSERGETSRIEIDKQGREVLIVTDAQGKEKRKVRKQKAQEPPPEVRHDLDDEKKPINTHHLPPAKEEVQDSEDDDIFEGVGSNYNPLAALESEGESEEEEEEEEGEAEDTMAPLEKQRTISEGQSTHDDDPDQPSTKPPATAHDPPARRNYFSRTIASGESNHPSEVSTADATVRAALQKVRTLDPNSSLINDEDSEESRLKVRLAKLSAADRDMEDMDMGFGESRFDDAEEMEREGEKVKFSEWKGIGGVEDEDDEGGARNGKKRKRGAKRNKGDKNSVADVLKTMERQKEKTLG
jgi:hypothetical protein